MPQELHISDTKIKSSKCNLNQREIYIRQTEIACIFATCFCDVKLHARHTCKKNWHARKIFKGQKSAAILQRSHSNMMRAFVEENPLFLLWSVYSEPINE